MRTLAIKIALLSSFLGAVALTALSGCTTDAFCFDQCDGDTGTTTPADGGQGGDLFDGGQGGNCGLFGCQDGGTGGQGGTCMFTGAEICDGTDNDCNGTIDDIADLDITLPKTCGTCDNSCYKINLNCALAGVTCDLTGVNPGQKGKCVCTQCDEGFYDVDKDGVTCEYQCVKKADNDIECNNKDDDCDVLVDEDINKCSDVKNCGSCNNNCVVLHGVPKCVNDGTMPCTNANTHCEIQQCDCNGPGDCWKDLDGDYNTGCEYNCFDTNGGIEVCGDGVDNDCDGLIDGADDLSGDPAIGVPCYGDPDGLCADASHAGATQCVGNKVTCVGMNLLHENDILETCNGVDDDCDGFPDDSPTDIGNSCGANNTAPCAYGVSQCQNGQLVCVGNVDPQPEICNGQDDNCNGVADDNTVDSGAACGQSGIMPCKLGNITCQGGVLLCVGNIDPQPELCDNVDNNCNGMVDDNPGGTGASCGQSNVAPCQFGSIQCQAGALTCVGAVNPQSESCDGVDNNCNGIIDDNASGTGAQCGQTDTGPCQFGTILCQAGALTCIGAVNPGQETCNGIDDNCNGMVDDNPIGVGGQCGQTDTGACAFGTITCQGGALVCVGEIGPQPEACDGLDNDCNGTVDDNPSGLGGQCGQTNVGPCEFGTIQCVNGGFSCVGAVNPVQETCDNVDNDCNGTVDDNPSGAGVACGQSNTAPCSFGTVLCQAGVLNCVGAVNPQTETCDGVDNNCNGTIDDNPTGTGGQCGQTNVGPCEFGSIQCQGGALTCVGAINPQTETCDGIDNNCNGTIDDNPSGIGGQCGPTNAGACEFGTVACQAGALTCVGAIGPQQETCNSIDDDCDGVVDDNATGTGVSCGQNNTFPCSFGTIQCQAGSLNCVGAINPTSETCDGVDNNCDGIIDNNPSGTGGQCGATNTGACEFGTTQCQGGTLTCIGAIGPQTETCNGIDDDCDGQIDDSPSGTGGTCGQTDTGPCSFGTIQCQAGSLVCIGEIGPQPELCDNIDNNCDGAVDNNVTNAGGSCGVSGVFPCQLGTFQCQSGALVCIGAVNPGTEVCNGVDDNCDGQIDLASGNPPSDSVGACNVPPPPPPGATSPCQAGNKACIGGAIVCQGSVGPTGQTDTCGVDANCDGALTNQPNKQTDVNNCGSCGNNCYANAVHSIWSCVAGACVFQGCENGYYDLNGDFKCEYACTFVSAQEACNGTDDNCNGTVDENALLPSPTQICGVDPSATTPECKSTSNGGQIAVVCQGGTPVCQFPAGVCNPTCATATEICDTLDNNCNGIVNENTPNYGQPCASDDGKPPPGDGACRTTGTFVCNGPNATVCSAVKANCASLPGGCTEKCDGIDNDCDGSVDEVYTAKGSNASFFVKPVVTKTGAANWIYTFEASRPDASAVTAGDGNGYQISAPAGTTLDKTVACSEQGRVPWFNVTPVEVEQTCAAMGGKVCDRKTEWTPACQATLPCTWGYSTRTAANCNTTFVAGSKFCNLGPSLDFDLVAAGDQDGLLITGSPALANCWADWSNLQGNGTGPASQLKDITGNLREVTRCQKDRAVCGNNTTTCANLCCTGVSTAVTGGTRVCGTLVAGDNRRLSGQSCTAASDCCDNDSNCTANGVCVADPLGQLYCKNSGVAPSCRTRGVACTADNQCCNGETCSGGLCGGPQVLPHGVFPIMGGAFNTADPNGATCTFDFFTVNPTFKIFDTGFRCCFTSDPTL